MAIDFIKGEKHIFLADSSLMKDESKVVYHIKGNWINKNLELPIRILSNENFQYMQTLALNPAFQRQNEQRKW